ncbi:MAG: alpha/beta fold hydrolase [Pseudomonadota bacterium]|nr:alpha/beta fold hydrolase [Pseudomonadota bacterium]
MSHTRADRIALSVIVVAVMLFLAGCASSPDAKEDRRVADAVTDPAAQQVEIFYATDRAPGAPGEYFGSERGVLSYGLAAVGIPPHHEVGRHETPSVFKFEWSPDERKHITVNEVTPLGQENFAELLERALDLSPGRKLLVFVHGYNVEFAEATRLLAQFATDLKFQGPALLFSWPSQGGVTGYAVDETNVVWAHPHLVQVLDEVLDETSAEQIYLVAHSIGSRAVTRAYITLAADRALSDLNPIVEMVLVAPDIDADLFRQDVAPRLASNGIHVTVYASSSDRALTASKAFHGYPRAGDSGEALVIVEGVETVDASDTASGLLGHSYFAEDRRVMEDIYGILQTRQRADGRFGLEAVDSAAGRYWTFRK